VAADDPLIGSVEMKFTIYVRCAFEPLPDITAYELACVLPYFHGKHMTEDDWNALGDKRRHFVRYG
jgi:hypothetical protein